MSKTVKEITEEIFNKNLTILRSKFNDLKKHFPDFNISEDKIKEIARRQVPAYLSCPANNNDPVSPNNCMFCPTGHILECHYPKTCREAQCSHLSRYEEEF